MSRFKTELCNNLIELGDCKYGDRCHYAHGAHELRQVSRRHPKYRTESCKNFELTGKCPFGPRCSYVHPKPDLDSMIEQLSKYMRHTKAPKPDSEDDDEDFGINNCNCDGDSNISLYNNTTTTIRTANNTFNSISPNISKISILNNHIINQTNLASNTSSRDIHDENKENQELVVNHHQLRHSNPSSLTTSTINTNNATSSSSLKSIYESTSPEINFNTNTIKKPRLINTINPSNSSDNNHIASNPFGIRNPLSDYINNTNINGRSPLQPNKQFYTRF